MNESVKKLLKESMWDLATCANGEPNVVPVAFKDVTPDGKLVVGDVFLDTTLKNLAGHLVFDPNVHCDHHSHGEGHTCGSHSCH